ncbi:MAG: AAA family ATPase [Nanoarchaeota archaeon]
MNKSLEQKLEELNFSNYINTNPVMQIGGKPIYIEDLIKSAVIGKLNTFLVSETGEGKTQIENDVLSLFGNKGIFVLGRDDMDVRALFATMGTDIKKVKNLAELRELTEKLKYNVYVVDELTRCLPAVQNQLFNLFDGYVEIDGKKYQIGDSFSLGLASGNLGNGRYLGAHQTDRALNDRMHLILDIDNFSVTPEDSFDITTKKRDPRVSETSGKDKIKIIKELNKQVNEHDPSLIPYMISWYFKHGLDYLPNVPGESKRKIKNIWPNVDLGHEKGADYDLIFPISTRTQLTALQLIRALSLIGAAKQAKEINYKDLSLDVFKLITPYSGVLNPAKVDTQFYGNPYLALDAIIQGINGELSYKPQGSNLTRLDALEEAISLAQKGKLDDRLNQEYFTARWKFMPKILEKIVSNYRSKND